MAWRQMAGDEQAEIVLAGAQAHGHAWRSPLVLQFVTMGLGLGEKEGIRVWDGIGGFDQVM